MKAPTDQNEKQRQIAALNRMLEENRNKRPVTYGEIKAIGPYAVSAFADDLVQRALRGRRDAA